MTNNAALYYCDTNDPTGSQCGTDYNYAAVEGLNWKSSTSGSHGLKTLAEAVGR